MALVDQYGRIADYLRIGLTDRCNLRCRYCMPAEGIDFSDRADLLSYEELVRLARIFKGLGVKKIRLTGGEPFVRRDIGQLLTSLTDIYDDLYITTNATLLHEHVAELKRLNVSGLNISIDSLDRERFNIITRRDQFDIVMANILACINEGIAIKLNMVVMRGVNDMEIIDFIKFGIKHRVEVRFIEAMPFNEDDGNKSVFLPAHQIESLIRSVFPSLIKKALVNMSSADHYLIDGAHPIGIIPAYTRSLCGSCNRIRLTPKGEMLTCLYAQTGLDLRALVRNDLLTDDQLSLAILEAVNLKKASGKDEEALNPKTIFNSMTTIGG